MNNYVGSRTVEEIDDSSSNVDWEQVARLEIHPRRFGLLQVLALDGNRTLSPSECAFELRTNVADANYHMTVLVGSGVVRLAHTIQVRGATEHFYCLSSHSADDLFERLGPSRMGH